MRRRVGLFLVCGLVLPLVAAANASAQGAVLELSPQSGPPGAVINVEGSGFAQNTETTILGGVNLRLMTRDAPVLRNAEVTPLNRFSTTLTIPAGTAPGEYLLLATETSVRGRHIFGTPARAKLRVTAAASAAGAAPSGGPWIPTAAAVGSAMLALILLSGGALAVRRQRAARRPLGSYSTSSR